MSKITRRNFLKVSGVAAAAAALTACGGSSSTASSAASGAASSEAASTAAKLDKIKVAVPNDTTNEARALTLLEKHGFFKLKADAGLRPSAALPPPLPTARSWRSASRSWPTRALRWTSRSTMTM